MRKWIMAGVALLTIAISSCSDETATLGNSLTSDVDRFTIKTDTFDITTRSLAAGHVLSRSSYSYLGCIKDPETGTYITCDYTTQFSILEKEAPTLFTNKDLVVGRDDNNEPIVDSCFVNIMLNSFQGDSLTAMKLQLLEYAEPLTSSDVIYTDFDPEEAGFIREDAGAINVQRVYSVSDLTMSDSLRNVYRQGGYYWYVKVPINKEYTDQEGNKYNNYGTYLMRKFYKDPSLFKNFNSFTRNVCPGFLIKTTDGQDLMIEVAYTQLSMYYRYKDGDNVKTANRTLNSTSEVLRATHIDYDETGINKLVAADTCTYLKTPAGIYTEVTLPIEDIMRGHETDTITSAKIVFRRMRSANNLSDIVLEEPTSVLLIERDSLYTFFENNGTPDYINAYVATFNSTQKTYSFNNICHLINRMAAKNGNSDNWNKAVLIPVQLAKATTTTTTATTVASVSNEMNVNSVRLVGGSNNKHAPIRMSVIYNVNQ